MILFDYIFYRLAKFFYRKDGVEAIRALGFIVVIQGLLIVSLLFFILLVSKVTLDIASFSKVIAIILLIVLGFFNYLRYKGRYTELEKRWSDKETKTESFIKGVLIVLIILLSYVLAIWTGLIAYHQMKI